jgi:hypothetical protein
VQKTVADHGSASNFTASLAIADGAARIICDSHVVDVWKQFDTALRCSGEQLST